MQLFERETRREKIIESRNREIKLREKHEAERNAQKGASMSAGIELKINYFGAWLLQILCTLITNNRPKARTN